MHDGSRSLLRFDRFTLDPARGCLRVGAEEIALRPKTYDVLRYLARHADRLVPKEEIIAAVWPSVFVTDDWLVHRVTELRQALGDRDQRIIRTVPRRGYRFVAPVSAVADGTVVLHVAERPEVPGGADYAGPAAARPGWPHPRHLAVAAVAALLLLGIGAAGWWRVPRGALEAVGPTTPDRPTVAVLPFDDLGGAARQQRQADAFTEDLIAELARSRELVVIARNSVESFKDKPTDVREIGRRLGVSHMLEGSLQLRPERLRVTAQLVEATTGAHLWTERYDRLAGDLFAVRDEILTRLVGTLTGYDGPIWAGWREKARRKMPQSLGAWDYFLLANPSYRLRNKEGNAQARQLLEKAIDLDPRFSRAWMFLAQTHFQDALNGWTADRARSWDLFHGAARRAVELDPNDAAAQVTLGMSCFTKDEVEAGSQAWERALALAPNDALVNRAIGTQLPIAFGVEHAARGVALVEHVLRDLDPLHPPFFFLNLAVPLYFAGRYAEAVAALEKVPDPWLEVRVMLALSAAQAGGADKARRNAEQVLRLEPGFTAEAWVDNDFYQPGGDSAALFYEGARKAGLPLCARPEEAVSLDLRNRLPECDRERAGVAKAKL